MSKTLKQYTEQLKRGRSYKGQIKGLKRPDLENIYNRSSWEANYERYLNFLDIGWEYEKQAFEFPIKRGTRFYTPDYWLGGEEKWVEVKGRLDSKSKTKLRRFKKYFPDEFAKLFVVTIDIYGQSKTARSVRRFLLCDLEMPAERIISYPAIDKQCRSIIQGWEK